MSTIYLIAAPAGFSRVKALKTIKNSALLVLVLLFSALSPWWASDPHVQNLQATLQAPSAQAWLGTDHLGRSIAARLGEAARISLALSIGSAAMAVLLGTALGLLAAWRAGWVDRVIGLCADAVAALPALLWVLLLATLAPGTPWPLYMGLVLTAWVEFFRAVRPTAAGLLASPQVQASQLLGFGPLYVIGRHVAPALLGTLCILTSYAVASAVLAVAALGFVGVGLQPPIAELGVMMTEALPYYREAPLMLVSPVLLLLCVVLGLQVLARSLQADGDLQPIAREAP